MSVLSGKFTGLRAWLLFAIMAGGVLWLLSFDFRPRPLFDRARLTKEFLYCTRGNPTIANLKLPRRGASAVECFASIRKNIPLKITVLDAENGKILAADNYQKSGLIRLKLTRNRATALQIRFESDAESGETAPRLKVAELPPKWPLTLGGNNLKRGYPFLLFYFEWPSLAALWAWALVPLAGWLCWKQKISLGIFTVVLGLCSMVSSVLIWQHDYSFLHYGHYDADRYGQCATQLASYLTNPGGDNLPANRFLRSFPHTTNVLGPALMAFPIALGASPNMTYLMFSSLCGFGTLLVFANTLQKYFRASLPVLLASLTLLAVHVHHLRAFARPITDEFGVFLMFVLLHLLIGRTEKVTRWQTFFLSSMLFILPLARPQGIAVAPVLLLGVLLCDVWREKKLDFWKRVATGFRLGILPAILLAALYLGFDWQHNFHLQMEKAARHSTAGKGMFFQSLFGVLQWMPIVWLFAKTEIWRRPPVWILAGWGLFYLAMLVGVDAPMKARHFLPLVPLLLLTGCALQEVRPRLRLPVWSLILLAIAANLTAVIYQLYYRLDGSLRVFIGTI